MDLRKRRLIFGGIFFALMFFYHGTTLFFQFVQVGSYVGWRGKSDDGKHFYTTTPDPTSPTALTQRGDELIAINGIHPAADHRVLELADRSPVGTPFTMTFSRNGQLFSIVGQTVPFPPGKYPYASRERLTLSLIWLVFLVTGLALILLKPENRQAWLLALMLGSFTGIIRDTYPYSYFGFALEVIVSLGKISAIWFFPLFALFFLNFPERSRLLLRLPRLERWIYWSNYVLLLPLWLGNSLPSAWRAAYINLPLLRVLFGWEPKFKLSISAYAIYLTAGFFFIGYNYWHANQAARRRMRVAILGSSPGFIALLLFVLNNFEFVRTLPHWATVIEWVQWLLYYVLALIPLSFAYAIIRHKVIPISFILRRGLRYLFVSRGATLLVILLLWLLVTRVLSSVFEHWRPSGLTIGWISAATTIAAMQFSKFVNQRFIGPVIDRKFFRQSYDAQQIMSELSESVRTVTSQPQLLELVATRIQSALQTHSVTIFLRDAVTGEFVSAHRCEYQVFSKSVDVNQQPLTLLADAPLLRQAADNRSVFDVEEIVSASSTDGEQQGIESLETPIDNTPTSASPHNSHDSYNSHQPQSPPLTPAEQELNVLRNLKSALLFPLKAKDELQGFIVVGSRLGDLPFTAEDKRLLAIVGAPTSFALENARLIEQRIEDARRREELEAQNEARRRELEEARQLQLSMLPKQVPQLPGLEIAAYMKTATEVGGDYYDFAVSKEGVLTLAIGDATGHGLKAGTVVTATKSLFNAHAHDANLAETFSLISRALKLMNMHGMFMALSLIRVENQVLRLTCAGMPPLFIYRAATGEIEEHLQKAVPLGSIKQYPYTEFTLAFHPGDLLLLMSDGLPERFDEGREMLGYEPIKQLLIELAPTATPQTLIERLLALGDDWASHEPLDDDDVTLLILKA